MVIYDYRIRGERIQASKDLVGGLFDVLGINSTKKMRDSIAINLKPSWYNMEKLSLIPDIKDEIIKRMDDLILNNKGDINYSQGLAHHKKDRERIIEDVEVALFEDKCFWITSPRMDNPMATQSMWNWQGYLSWSLVNNNVNVINYNYYYGGGVRAPNDKEQLLFLHIALGVPDKNGKQSLYFKLLPKSAMRDHIRGPMSNQVMAGHYLKHPLMVNWNIPIKIFFCDGQDYNFLNWDGSPFIKQ